VVKTAFVAANSLFRIAIRPLIVSSFVLSCKDNKVSLRHGRLGHLGFILFRKIILYIVGHNLQPTNTNSMALCQACKANYLQNNPYGNFITNYHLCFQGYIVIFVVQLTLCLDHSDFFIDASSRQSHVSLLSMRKLAFADLLSMLIRFKAHFYDYPIKTLCMDNVQEF